MRLTATLSVLLVAWSSATVAAMDERELQDMLIAHKYVRDGGDPTESATMKIMKLQGYVAGIFEAGARERYCPAKPVTTGTAIEAVWRYHDGHAAELRGQPAALVVHLALSAAYPCK